MAAVHPHKPPRTHHTHSRIRSSSDPFSDPNSRQRPPPPPPKTKRPSTATRMPTAVPKDVADITEAVRDTVVLRDRSDSPRTRMGRSQTTVTPTSPSSKPSTKRSQSQDSGQIKEKQRSGGKARGKKGSQHADVIDRLDYTGVGLFHHDGPFDACAPSRNKQRNNAPLYSWTNAVDPTQYGDSAYPAAHAYQAFSNDYPDPPKKRVDAIAEAWGIHEPEPYEEFFAGGGSTRPDGDTPASSIYNGRDSHSNSNSASRSGVPKRGKDEPQAAKDQRRVATRRSLAPPPQPIFVPGVDDVAPPPSSYSPPPTGSPGFPKRQKSLMQRIRKMRDAPNVPVGAEYEQPPSPNSPLDQSVSPAYPTRPTHKPQNSFLGRFGGKAPPQGADRSEPFLLIDPQPSNNKDLPPPPPLGPTASGDSAQGGSNPEFGGINRKTSIMKKMGRVVRGNR